MQLRAVNWASWFLPKQALAEEGSKGYATGPMIFNALFAAVARLSADADEALLARVATRDPQALRILYDRCSSIALAVSLRIMRSRPEAEEVVQETFIEVWKRADGFDGQRGSAAGWIVAIARSRALDRLRARSSAERAASAAQAEEAPAVPLPIESAEQRQVRDRIQVALSTLPPEQRTAIELSYYQGLTQREIADRTGDPLGTVKTRVRLALAKLASLLEEVSLS